VVIREEDQPNEIFFIKTGRVKIIKRLNFKVHPMTKGLLLGDPSEPTAEDIAKGNYKSMLIEVDELSHGDSFCDHAIFNKEPMHHSVVCSIPSELIALPLYDLSEMNERTLTEYKAVCKPYPDNFELRKMYLDLYRWNVWKKSLYKNVQIEKINKRRGFNQQLREPFLKMVQMENLSIPLENSGNIDLLAMAHKGFTTSKAGLQKLGKSGLGASAFLQTEKLEMDSYLTKSTKASHLPKIGKSSRYKEGYSDYNLGTSNRDGKGSNTFLKSFDFVVPQHKLSYLAEQESFRNALDGDGMTYGNIMQTSHGYLPGSEGKKGPYLYGLNNSPGNDPNIPEIPDSPDTTEGDGGKSVLGTRAIAKTFSKVFNDVSLPGSVLPSIRK